jgi:uncharacterized membrane protein
MLLYGTNVWQFLIVLWVMFLGLLIFVMNRSSLKKRSGFGEIWIEH